MIEYSTSTIGFTQTSASNFFRRLQNAKIRKVIDVRLNNTSQLSAFAKANDLAYFLKKIGNIDYEHKPILAPTADMLTSYKKMRGEWNVYEDLFIGLMQDRKIEKQLRPEEFDGACLLCSEATPHYCHRRLVCEYLNSKWNHSLKVKHL